LHCVAHVIAWNPWGCNSYDVSGSEDDLSLLMLWMYHTLCFSHFFLRIKVPGEIRPTGWVEGVSDERSATGLGIWEKE
jgi:hypothetical protein